MKLKVEDLLPGDVIGNEHVVTGLPKESSWDEGEISVPLSNPEGYMHIPKGRMISQVRRSANVVQGLPDGTVIRTGGVVCERFGDVWYVMGSETGILNKDFDVTDFYVLEMGVI